MWKAWAHPLWPGGEVWFRHYMWSQPRIKCANSRCCILGCVRCLVFFPPRLGCFLCSCASRAELLFFFYSHLPAWPSDSCSVCQLVTLGGSRRGEFDGGKKRKKKRGRGPAVALQAPRCLSSTPAALEHSEEKKGFPTRCWIPFVWFMVEESLWKVGFVCHLCIWILAFCAVLEQSQYYMTYI